MTALTLNAGDSLVWFQRPDWGNRLRPLGMDVTYTAREWMRLSNHHDKLQPGDVLTFPHDFGQALVSVEVLTERLWNEWAQTVARHFPGHQLTAPAITLRFPARVDCPACDCCELNPTEMPDLAADPDMRSIITRRYVVRTCVVCDTSWEQEVEW